MSITCDGDMSPWFIRSSAPTSSQRGSWAEPEWLIPQWNLPFAFFSACCFSLFYFFICFCFFFFTVTLFRSFHHFSRSLERPQFGLSRSFQVLACVPGVVLLGRTRQTDDVFCLYFDRMIVISMNMMVMLLPMMMMVMMVIMTTTMMTIIVVVAARDLSTLLCGGAYISKKPS